MIFLAVLLASLAGIVSAQAPKDAPPAPASGPATSVVVPSQAPSPRDNSAATAETIENPYGIEALWKQGDFVARGTLIILIIMSIGTWYIGIVKYIEQARLFTDWREADTKFWAAKGGVNAGAAELREDSAFRYMAEEGVIAVKDHSAMPKQQIDLNTWVSMSLDRAVDVINNRLQTGLAFLATVGSTAPFVGLFGTVWGIYHALTAIGIAGQASIDKVAGPVGEALIMTALGLAVAVPAVLGYNWLVRRNRVAMEEVRRFGSGLQMTLLGGGHTQHKAA
ncbi:MAG TPA: MotA/TolQ/ExbB proton channel family protein [Burkholderiales bacterium]|nr:MotA/TolQ/ExbB proton channel family protein [Burkholderiales bacterium]